MVLSIQAYVLAEEVDCRRKDVAFSFKFPATWWQHFKQSLFPRWLLGWFPVKYKDNTAKKRVIFRRLATYPKANIVIPDKVGDTVVYRNVWEEAYWAVKSVIEMGMRKARGFKFRKW